MGAPLLTGVKTWFHKLSTIMAPHAVEVLALSGLASFLIYFLVITQKTPLLSLWQMKLLDLGNFLERNPWPALEILAGFLILGVLYGLAYWAVDRVQTWKAWLLVIGWALLFFIPLLLIYPYGAADIFDNIVHGRILGVYGANPFAQAAVNFDNDPFVPYSYWKKAPSAYGPLWEVMAAGAARLAGDGIITNIFVFKLLPGLFLLGSAALIALILRKESPAKALGGFLLLAWNPSVIYETVGNGHNDPAMIFWVLAAALAMQRKKFTTALCLLTVGGLVKYIPFLLIPIAGMIALASLPDLKTRLKFTLVSAVPMLLLVAASYLPFWTGPETLTLTRRAHLFISSLPTLVFLKLIPYIGLDAAGNYVSTASALLTGGFTLWMAFRAFRAPGWKSFLRYSFYSFMFYLLVACPWFQVWYALWPLAIAIPLLPAEELGLAILFSFTALLKAFFTRPLFIWNIAYPDRFDREIVLILGSLSLVWIYSAYLVLRKFRRRHA
jgi:alpha-1,6-mannosyltransferase